MRAPILLVLAVAFPTVAEAGPCAIRSLSPQPLAVVPVAPAGGVIVGLVRGGFSNKSSDTAVDKAWRFKDVNKLVEPSVQDIAPGLAVYTLPPTGGPELLLLDGDGKEVTKVVRASKATPALTAPPLKSLEYVTQTSKGPRRGWETYTTGTADVGMQVPENAAALILYEVTKDGNRARSWTTVLGTPREPRSTQVIAYQTGGRCNPGVPGISPIADGTKVVAAWLDTSGRLSPVSKPVTSKAITRK